MSRTKMQDVKFCKDAFNKAMKRLEGQKIDIYALFCVGFKSGRNYQKKAYPNYKNNPASNNG